MNSNAHNQTSDNSSFSILSKAPSIRLLLQLPNPIYNPTTADVERLSQLYAQYFFLSFRTTTKLPKITNLKFTTDKSLLQLVLSLY